MTGTYWRKLSLIFQNQPCILRQSASHLSSCNFSYELQRSYGRRAKSQSERIEPMSSHKTFALVMALLFLGVELVIYFVSEAGAVQSRMVGVGVIFMIIGLALFDNLFEVSGKAEAWQVVADRLGVKCERGNFFTGYTVQVIGTFRERRLNIYTHKRGKGQVASTRVELVVKNPATASLRLRGPFNKNQTTFDPVTSDLFGAAEARQFGDDTRFFIRSKPVHLVTSMFRTGPLRDKLLKLRPLATIELEGKTIFFEQLGTLQDVDYLQFVTDLLSDTADLIELERVVKLAAKPAKG